MKVFVVSGFLGAGKTTFIKELARRTHRDFAIMENEYSEVGIDGALLRDSQPDPGEKLNIWELTEGCICCSMKKDFATSVLTIANTVDPEFLVVEPTGVGKLSKVLENLSKIQYERISLLSPITLVDGNSFQRYRAEYADIYQDQLVSAGNILVTKMENADPEDLDRLATQLQELAPCAEICTTHYSQNSEEWWQSLLKRPCAGAKPLPEQPEESVTLENLGLTEISLPSGNHLLLFLQGVVSGVFGNICRAKGYLQTGEAWLRFDVVDRTYSITGCDPMPDPRAVFIGEKLKRSLLREVLQQPLLASPVKVCAHRKIRAHRRIRC